MNKLDAAREYLEEMAIRYARMKLLGEYLDPDGSRVRVAVKDQKVYEQTCAQDLLAAAMDLLAVLAATPLPPRGKP